MRKQEEEEQLEMPPHAISPIMRISVTAQTESRPISSVDHRKEVPPSPRRQRRPQSAPLAAPTPRKTLLRKNSIRGQPSSCPLSSVSIASFAPFSAEIGQRLHLATKTSLVRSLLNPHSKSKGFYPHLIHRKRTPDVSETMKLMKTKSKPIICQNLNKLQSRSSRESRRSIQRPRNKPNLSHRRYLSLSMTETTDFLDQWQVHLMSKRLRNLTYFTNEKGFALRSYMSRSAQGENLGGGRST